MTAQPCPALHILRGAMGKEDGGRHTQPEHSRNKHGQLEHRCRFCHSTR